MSTPKFPYTTSREEVKRIVNAARNIHMRVGQAVACNYTFPKELEDKLWENNDLDQVVQILCDHFHKPDYQI